jgi:hypothetical protein
MFGRSKFDIRVTVHLITLLGLASSSKIYYHKGEGGNNNSKILKLSLLSKADGSSMESRMLCFNGGIIVEWQTLQATQRRKSAALKGGLRE